LSGKVFKKKLEKESKILNNLNSIPWSVEGRFDKGVYLERHAFAFSASFLSVKTAVDKSLAAALEAHTNSRLISRRKIVSYFDLFLVSLTNTSKLKSEPLMYWSNLKLTPFYCFICY